MAACWKELVVGLPGKAGERPRDSQATGARSRLILVVMPVPLPVRRWWADDLRFQLYKKETQHEASQLYILCYLALVLCFILLLLSRDSIFSVWHIVGSTRLHNQVRPLPASVLLGRFPVPRLALVPRRLASVALVIAGTVCSLIDVSPSSSPLQLQPQLFMRVLRAPILFFLRTPVGDVLNSFAKDQVRWCCCSCCLRLEGHWSHCRHA